MNALRIKKDGRYLHYYCEVCKSDELHLIQVHRYEMYKVVFAHFCTKCFIKHENKKSLLKSGFINSLEDFYGTIDEMDNEDWNNFNKWADYE